MQPLHCHLPVGIHAKLKDWFHNLELGSFRNSSFPTTRNSDKDGKSNYCRTRRLTFVLGVLAGTGGVGEDLVFVDLTII